MGRQPHLLLQTYHPEPGTFAYRLAEAVDRDGRGGAAISRLACNSKDTVRNILLNPERRIMPHTAEALANCLNLSTQFLLTGEEPRDRIEAAAEEADRPIEPLWNPVEIYRYSGGHVLLKGQVAYRARPPVPGVDFGVWIGDAKTLYPIWRQDDVLWISITDQIGIGDDCLLLPRDSDIDLIAELSKPISAELRIVTAVQQFQDMENKVIPFAVRLSSAKDWNGLTWTSGDLIDMIYCIRVVARTRRIGADGIREK